MYILVGYRQTLFISDNENILYSTYLYFFKQFTYCQIKIFDANNDGKLELNEMARLLPVKENVLKDTMSGAILKVGQTCLLLI